MPKKTTKKTAVFSDPLAVKRITKKPSVFGEADLVDPQLVQVNALVEKLMVSAGLNKQKALEVVSVLNAMT